jgi:hypothetical protein
MTDKNRAKFIFERWSISVKREDRRKENMSPLFDSIASELFVAGVPFDMAHSIMREASKSLYPSKIAVQRTYNQHKNGSTFVEFTKAWHDTLDKLALEAFYSYYPIDEVDAIQTPISKKHSINIKVGAKSEDEANEEDFWKSVRSVTKTNPWLFNDEDK